MECTPESLIDFPGELKQRGFHVLARSQDYIYPYAVAIGAARRSWAKQNENLLVRYIRAYLRSIDWTLDPKNKAEAVQTLQSVLKNSPAQAEAAYQEAVDPKTGLIPKGKIDREGIRVILQIREVMGEMKPPLPSPDKYLDEQYYQKAIASLAGKK